MLRKGEAEDDRKAHLVGGVRVRVRGHTALRQSASPRRAKA